MFTDTMTAREIRLIVKHESEALDRTMTRFVKEFRKRIRGRRKGGVFQIGHLFKTHEKNEYYAILTNANKDEVYTALLPTYMTNKGRVFFSESERSNDEYTVIGPHFLKRYKERTYQEDKDLEQALMDSTWACREGKTIYETEIVNNKQGRVVAVLDGLILGDCDLDKGFYYARTYVSDDMLQPIQREAKKLLNDHLFDRCINYVLDSTNKLEIEEHDDLVDSLNAKSIYAKYYASTEEHLDFLVTNAPEDIKLDFKYNNSSAQKSKRKTEIPAVVQKMAGDKRVRLASVLEDQIPIVYIYLATSLKIGNRYEEAILYCPYTDKAARVRNSEMSTHKLQTTVIEITKR